MVGRPSKMFGSGRESLSELREWSEALPALREF